MDARTQLVAVPAGHELFALPGSWRRGLALTLFALLSLVALLLAVRCAAGALASSLPIPALILAGLVLAIASCAIRRLWYGAQCRSHLPLEAKLILWGPLVPLVVTAIVLAIPGPSDAGLAAFCTMLLVGEAYAIHSFWNGPHATPIPRPSCILQDVAATDTLPAEVTQQFTRRHTAAGEDVIQGVMRAEFAAGERTAMMHVVFCPPFERTPELHFEQLDGPAARIKPGPVHPFGARLEVRLNQPASGPTNLLMEVVAQG